MKNSLYETREERSASSGSTSSTAAGRRCNEGFGLKEDEDGDIADGFITCDPEPVKNKMKKQTTTNTDSKAKHRGKPKKKKKRDGG